MEKDTVFFEIGEYRDNGFRPLGIRAIRESVLRILVNGRETARLMCTGESLRCLVAGYLLTCGLIQARTDILDLAVEEGQGAFLARVRLREPLPTELGVNITSGLGREVRPARMPPPAALPEEKAWLPPRSLINLAQELEKRSTLYRQTRGCHNSSLCTATSMLVFCSDIGRHNAIDAIVGRCLLEDLPVADKILVTTGRIASEIVHKALRAGIPVLASTAVATSLAVDMARRYGLTLIGNVSDTGFWVYNDPGRLAEG